MILSSVNLCVLLVFCTSLLANRVGGDMFTSISIMESLFNSEMNATGLIDKYIKSELERHQLLRNMVDDYESQTRQWLQTIDHSYLQNPVAAYSILKHLATGWIEIEEIMRRNSADEVLTPKGNSKVRSLIPNITDVEGAAVALMRLQETYKLDTDLLANGQFPGVPRYGALSAKDCYDIGVVAYNLPDDYQAILWLEEALNRFQMEQDSPSINEPQILAYLCASYFNQDMIPRAIVLAKRWLELEPGNPDAIKTVGEYEARLQEIHSNGTEEERKFLSVVANGNTWSIDQLDPNKTCQLDQSDLHYHALCRGENNAQANGLTCYYKNDTHFLRLARLKVEVSHLNPDVLLFRDVISPVEVEKFKKLAEPKLARSAVKEPNGQTIASYRISSNAWLTDKADPVVARVSRRVGDMTSLDMKYAEACQVANYGLGGHYEVHHDCGMHYMTPEEQAKAFGRRYNYSGMPRLTPVDNRIATVMFYLVQPISGGATVFPQINMTIYPTAGDAVFWFNVKKNGYEDPRLRHAACPVLTGSKWVLNKWISVKHQEIIRPCSFNEDE